MKYHSPLILSTKRTSCIVVIVALLPTLFGSSFVVPRQNTYPCTPQVLVQEHNRIRQDPAYLYNAINARYPNPSFDDKPWVDRALQFLSGSSNFAGKNFRTLKLNPTISIATGLHAHTQAYYTKFSHTGCNGTSPSERVTTYANASGVGENLWMQRCTAGRCRTTCLNVLMDLVIDKGWEDPGHRHNIYYADFEYLGVSVGGKTENYLDYTYVGLNYAVQYSGPTALAEGKEGWADYFLQNFKCPDEGLWGKRVYACPNIGSNQACNRDDFVSELNQLRRNPSTFADTIEANYNTDCYGGEHDRLDAIAWLRQKQSVPNSVVGQKGYLNYVASFHANTLSYYIPSFQDGENFESLYYGCDGRAGADRVAEASYSWNKNNFVGEVIYAGEAGENKQFGCEELLARIVIADKDCKDRRDVLLDSNVRDVGLGISGEYYVAEFTKSTPSVGWFDTNVLRYNKKYVCYSGTNFGLSASQQAGLRECRGLDEAKSIDPSAGIISNTDESSSTQEEEPKQDIVEGSQSNQQDNSTEEDCTQVRVSIGGEWLPTAVKEGVSYREAVLRLKAMRKSPKCFEDKLRQYAQADKTLNDDLAYILNLINSTRTFANIEADEGLFNSIELHLQNADLFRPFDNWNYPFRGVSGVNGVLRAVYIKSSDYNMDALLAELLDLFYNDHIALFSTQPSFDFIGFGVKEVPNTGYMLLLAQLTNQAYDN